MQIQVYGQIGNGPVMEKIVSARQLAKAWGPWTRAVLSSRKHRPLVVDGRKVWVIIPGLS